MFNLSCPPPSPYTHTHRPLLKNTKDKIYTDWKKKKSKKRFYTCVGGPFTQSVLVLYTCIELPAGQPYWLTLPALPPPTWSSWILLLLWSHRIRHLVGKNVTQTIVSKFYFNNHSFIQYLYMFDLATVCAHNNWMTFPKHFSSRQNNTNRDEEKKNMSLFTFDAATRCL